MSIYGAAQPKPPKPAQPQYGSEIEQIARESTLSSQQRTAQTRRLVKLYLRANRKQLYASSPQLKPIRGANRIHGSGPPVGLNAGVHGKIRPNAPIVTIRDGQGHSVQVNKSVADEFKAFLRALKRKGYNIDSIGGYANRNIAGTSTRSLHSYGLAIDINPSLNPVSYGNNMQTNFPHYIKRLARRYGLAWGGAWHGSKNDPMHFSFPMFGTK